MEVRKMKLPVALQLYSVRWQLEEDFEGTLAQVKAMGYDGVEFAGLYGHTASEVKALCEKLGLTPVSAHVPFADMMADPELLNVYAEIGCEFVVIPYLTEEYRPGQPKFAEVIAGAKMLGEKAKSLGLKLCYHNHDFEFVKVAGEYALDVLYKEVSADLLQTQLDTCWVKVAGEDPVAYLHKYAGRCEIVHLKDFVGEKTANMYALIGIDEKEEKKTAFEFRPVGFGRQDMPAIVEASIACGAKWLVVEQDQPSMGLTPVQCAEKSLGYVKGL